MGVVAGALGSSFDDDAELRRVTHGRREQDRLVAHDADGAGARP